MNELDLIERALRREGEQLAGQLPAFGERAAQSGLVDIAYTVVDSPLGPLLLAGTERGLIELHYLAEDQPGSGLEPQLTRLAARVSPRVLELPARLDPARRQLDEYFAGRRHGFELALDWSQTRGFSRRVLEATARIPYGSLASYRDVAAAAGSPRATRAAGNALGANPIPIVVPCHRIVRTGGGIGGYTGGVERKRALLALEGMDQ